MASLTCVHDLFTGSWIDELDSGPGVDLGTWIGEAEEKRGWEALGRARDFLDRAGATPSTHPAAFDALYRAEGSDWFWWFGADQESGDAAAFDDLFRAHLTQVYRGAGAAPPPELDWHIVPRAVVWTFANQVAAIQPGDRLTVRTNCPGVLRWRIDDGTPQEAALAPAGGVMAGARRYHLTLSPVPPEAGMLRFRFTCAQPGCDGRDICGSAEEHHVAITAAVMAAGPRPAVHAAADEAAESTRCEPAALELRDTRR